MFQAFLEAYTSLDFNLNFLFGKESRKINVNAIN